MTGKVSLVGAGPGDPELLTLKAAKAIENADSIVYDRLVSDDIMALVPRGIPRFFAGKSCKQKAMTQEEINELLVHLAQRGDHVVRLKGGDPLLFGRGGEEALELFKANIPFEIIPGITSAQGCAAYAGIPLTHRGMATGVRFLTGHRMTAEESAEPLELNWTSLADADTTLVIYMGLANLEFIAQKLMEHGLAGHMPVAVISHGTTPQQRIVQADLGTIANKVIAEKLESPTLVIIGHVAALAAELQWFKPQELENSDVYKETFIKMSQ